MRANNERGHDRDVLLGVAGVAQDLDHQSTGRELLGEAARTRPRQPWRRAVRPTTSSTRFRRVRDDRDDHQARADRHPGPGPGRVGARRWLAASRACRRRRATRRHRWRRRELTPRRMLAALLKGSSASIWSAKTQPDEPPHRRGRRPGRRQRAGTPSTSPLGPRSPPPSRFRHRLQYESPDFVASISRIWDASLVEVRTARADEGGRGPRRSSNRRTRRGSSGSAFAPRRWTTTTPPRSVMGWLTSSSDDEGDPRPGRARRRRDALLVENVAVRPAAQGRGVGRALLAHADGPQPASV